MALTRPTGRTNALWWILCAGVAAFVANQAIGVTLPLHIVTTNAGDAADVGAVGASATIGVVIGRLLSGSLVAHVGVRITGAAASAVTAVVCVTNVVATDSIAGLAVLRLVHGMAFACATTALYVGAVSLLSDRAAPDRTSSAATGQRETRRAISVANIAMPAALLVAPLVALEVLNADLVSVAIAASLAAVVGGAAFLASSRSQPESARSRCRPATPDLLGRAGRLPRPVHAFGREVRHALAGARRLPAVAVVVAVLLGACDAALLDYLPLLSQSRSLAGLGWAYTCLSAALICVFVGLTLRRTTVPSSALAGLGTLVAAGGAIALAMTPSTSVLLIAVGVSGVGFAVGQTGANTLATAEVRALDRPGAVAAVLLAFDVGRIVAVYSFGILITHTGPGTAFAVLAGALAFGGLLASSTWFWRALPK